MKGVNVEIMGQSLTVMSDSGDEWAKTLAATVDEKNKRHSRQQPRGKFHKRGNFGGVEFCRRTRTSEAEIIKR